MKKFLVFILALTTSAIFSTSIAQAEQIPCCKNPSNFQNGQCVMAGAAGGTPYGSVNYCSSSQTCDKTTGTCIIDTSRPPNTATPCCNGGRKIGSDGRCSFGTSAGGSEASNCKSDEVCQNDYCTTSENKKNCPAPATWNENSQQCIETTNCSNQNTCPPSYTRQWGGTNYSPCKCEKLIFDAVNIKPQECIYSYSQGGIQGTNIANKGIRTALGCIPTDISAFIGWIFGYGIAIGGGVAFLLMSWGAFLLITSAGNPEQLKNGQETLVSAGAGLIFIIFAVFLLRLIGVNILKIPGFN